MDKKTVVLTMYGKGDQIKDISIALFDLSDTYRGDGNAIDYCKNMNQLKLQDNEWIHTRIIKQNKKIRLEKPREIGFDIIKKLNKKQIGTLLDVYDRFFIDIEDTMAIALKDGSIKDTFLNNYLTNPSLERSYWIDGFFKKYEKIETVSQDEIATAQQKVAEAIKQMITAGRIVIDFEETQAKEE